MHEEAKLLCKPDCEQRIVVDTGGSTTIDTQANRNMHKPNASKIVLLLV